ncbi:MAG: radical SAM family heme chaperone HemW [Flavisolibacter sp.]
MAGIYLHIPFCRQACHYCNFHFTTSLRYKDELLAAMIKETEAEKDYLQGESVQTLYFGGGTPSLLTTEQLEAQLNSIFKHFKVSPDAEITLEANPDDITVAQLQAWKAAGINRLSIGVQSFMEDELRWMNRAHTAIQASENLEHAANVFDNITIDLIYGSPLLSDEQWKAHVDKATGMGIPHLSCYALTVEEKTPLHKHIRQKISMEVDQDKQARQFLLLMQWMKEKGYEHYEVSNFAKPGFRSQHNSAYWKGTSYLGLGPSAHSYNGKERRWNIANNAIYIQQAGNSFYRETELLTPVQQLNEYIMISLRTMEGISLESIEKKWGSSERKRIETAAEKFNKQGLTRTIHDHIQLTDDGMLRADGLASELFL